MIAIFDIGSNNGFNGLAFALFNPKINVFSFEPNPELKKIVFQNKRIVEKKFKIELKNFTFIEKAVSNQNEHKTFYITTNDATSSLLRPKKNLNKYWTENTDITIKNIANWIKIKKKIRIKTLRLQDFCKKKKISKICYIHCDTQGNDLNVFEGLGQYRKIVNKGVLESIIDTKLSLYNNYTNLNKIKKKFKQWGYKINVIDEFHKRNPERNIYFTNSKISKRDYFIFPTEKNLRLLNRVLRGKTRIKDLINIFFIGKKFNN